MKVTLVAYTPDSEEHIRRSAGRSRRTDNPSQDLVSKLIDWGHESPLEHSSFTFLVEDVSRALTHQLVRHRIASYTQESSRVAVRDKPEYVTPETWRKAGLLWHYKDFMEYCWILYHAALEAGIPKEDARYILPDARYTSIVVTMNCRSLRNFFKQRLAKEAQWEIRELAEKMLDLVKPLCPNVFKDIEKLGG